MEATNTGWNFGYARVSTEQQDLERQMDALRNAGIPDENVFVDKKTGANAAREGLTDLRSRVRPGDTITVYTLDRLGRNVRDVLNLVHELDTDGVHIRSIADAMPVDTANSDAMSRMAMMMLAMFAEMERVYARERAAHARAVRRKNGKRVGRKRAHSAETIEYAQLLRSQGASLYEIATKTAIPKSSLHRYLTPETVQ